MLSLFNKGTDLTPENRPWGTIPLGCLSDSVFCKLVSVKRVTRKSAERKELHRGIQGGRKMDRIIRGLDDFIGGGEADIFAKAAEMGLFVEILEDDGEDEIYF